MIMKRVLTVALTLLLAAGCKLPSSSSSARRFSPYRAGGIVKPVVAVSDFENLASPPAQWNLGRGMADLLITELLDTEKVTVLERKDLGDVVGEIVLQGKEIFRKEGRVERGRLKNAKYLLRGVVTDFSEMSRKSGKLGIPGFSLFGGKNRARVAINIKVSDVETGEIVASVKVEEIVSAGGVGAEGRYKNVQFGGDAFFRTPLGKATERAIRDATKRVLRELPVSRWTPRVAEAGPDGVIINGGEDVRLREGSIFLVREAGRDMTDPETGNVIERVPGKVVGRVRVVSVQPLAAHAELLEGKAQRGQFLVPVE